MNEKVLVIPDLHGHSQHLAKVEKMYGDRPDRYVLLGDMLSSGLDPAGVLELAKKLGATTLAGNHEITLLQAMKDSDIANRIKVRRSERDFSVGSLRKFIDSYDLHGPRRTSEILKRLESEMEKRDHWRYLAGAAMYYENNDMICIHAGLQPHIAWPNQRQSLDKIPNEIADGRFSRPIQIFDTPEKTLSNYPTAFRSTKKIVVTGHAHSPRGERLSEDKKRVRLASRLREGEPLFVYESWSQRIRQIEPS